MAGRPVLELAGVGKTYGSGSAALNVLRDVDLRVEEGEHVAVVGPSGSGKSTLLNILGLLDRPTTGTYRLLGDEVSRADDRTLSRLRNQRIGFVFQSFQLVPHLSVFENVELPLFYLRMPRRQRHERALLLIERVGLGARARHLPTELSGGECQRAAIARALAGDPALILADEPTGNLDTRTSAEIMAMFHELHRAGRTLVVITHDPGIAAAAPRCVALRDGQVESDRLTATAGATATASGAEAVA